MNVRECIGASSSFKVGGKAPETLAGRLHASLEKAQSLRGGGLAHQSSGSSGSGSSSGSGTGTGHGSGNANDSQIDSVIVTMH